MRQKSSPAMKINLVARMLRHSFDRRARYLGITRAQWQTIGTVRREPGATQHRIACLLEIGDVTAGRMIDKLAEEGWVERRPDPADRRVNRVYLTPLATPIWEKIAILGQDEERRAFAGIGAEDLAILENLLDRVIANLAEPLSSEETVSEEIAVA